MRHISASRRLVVASLLALPALSLQPAVAATDPAAARAMIEKLAADTVAVLRSTEVGSQDRAQKLAQILRRGFDLPYLAQLAVGRGWRDMSQAERDRFIKVFTEWVVQTQSVRLGQYAGEQFEVGQTQPTGDRDVMVASKISGGKLTQPVDVDWRVRSSRAPLIIDVVIAGVSMVVTYRNEFQPIIQRGGVQALIEELEKRSAQAG
jgi:phospholipid transport system substrate-binding protein